MYNTNDNLDFLRKKVETIKTALFKTEYDYAAGLPNNVVSTLFTDNEGHIWFYTSVSDKYSIDTCEEFYAYLDYHHKGGDSCLRIGGKAVIADNNYEADMPNGAKKYSKLVLIKLKMMNVEYYEYTPKENAGLFTALKQLCSSLWISSKERNFDFS